MSRIITSLLSQPALSTELVVRRMDLMLSAASLCIVGYPFLLRQTTLEGEEAAVLEEEAEIMNATIGGCMPCVCG